MKRRGFFQTLLAPLVALVAPRAKGCILRMPPHDLKMRIHEGGEYIPAPIMPPTSEPSGVSIFIDRPGLNLFCALPCSHITGLTTIDDRQLIAHTDKGMFEVFGDGSWRLLSTDGGYTRATN